MNKSFIRLSSSPWCSLGTELPENQRTAEQKSERNNKIYKRKKKEPQMQTKGANKYNYLIPYHPTNQLTNLPIKQKIAQ
jgi:hypothetical protein